ncbi:Persulfide dioxygenase ETHE1, mitochondrial [Chionoecetes opilio]|uniref:Persulfide dioxygenase ETHE1, mitochondrial n=1 Tax=Chionoecetes opilio TaxID=41210 RepID=A0A8J5CGJ2_CHIOP|nr:Persulfide dioxygenase ETHE1, mitochondrial [Chionoecetes opilio]
MLRGALRPVIAQTGRHCTISKPYSHTIKGKEQAGAIAASLRRFSQAGGPVTMIFRQYVVVVKVVVKVVIVVIVVVEVMVVMVVEVMVVMVVEVMVEVMVVVMVVMEVVVVVMEVVVVVMEVVVVVEVVKLFDRDSCTYTYLLADPNTKEAVLVDPVIELAERDAKLVKEMGLSLKYVMNTHVHADHITGSGLLKKLVPGCRSLISQVSGATADVHVHHGEVVTFGKQQLEVRRTPGHTYGCVTYVCHNEKFALTGDALLIRGCGRTDFQEGSSETCISPVHSQILSLPDTFALYPAHDYVGQTVTSVAEEKTLNPRLTKSKEEFITIMSNLGLAYPRKIDVSLPANKVCGLYNLPEDLAAKLADK